MSGVSLGPEVSVVIPAYNSMPYLEGCLVSVLAQSHANIRVIVVDDGSTDETAEYLASIEDERVLPISVPNGGVSAARNLALEHARGEYVTFVDADDAVNPAFIENALAYAVKNDLDIAVGGLAKDYGSRREFFGEPLNGVESKVFEGGAIQKVIEKTIAYSVPGEPFMNSFFMSGSVCKLFRTSAIGDVRFDSEIPVGEDTLFNVMVLRRCTRVGFMANNWYTYFIRSESALGRYNPRAFEESERLLEKVRSALADVEGSEWPCFLANRALRRFEGACLSTIGHDDSQMSFMDALTYLSDAIDRQCWQSLFDDAYRWLPELRGRYRFFGRLCQGRHLYLICAYAKLLARARKVRNGLDHS